MRDLRHQIRDYIDESADPVTIEDVFFAGHRTLPEALRPTSRRPWVIATAAAALTALLFGLVPRLIGDSTTPSTVPPATTSPTPTTTTSATTTTATSSPPSTTVPAVALPDGDVVSIDEQLGAVLADLLVGAGDLGWESPVYIDASLEAGGEPGPDEPQPWIEQPHVLATLSVDVREGGWGHSRIGDSGTDVSLEGATVRVFATVDEAAEATEVLMEELLQGIPRVVLQRTPFDLIEAGDDSAASYFELNDDILVGLVVRDGNWVLSVNLTGSSTLLDQLASDEAQAELRSFLDAIIGSRGRGADLDVSLLRVPLTPPRADGLPYEHGWGIDADVDGSATGDIERGYAMAITDDGVRCRISESPVGHDEPVNHSEYVDDGSGTVTLFRRYVVDDGESREESIEMGTDDPRYVQALSGCLRFDPIGEVLEHVFAVAPEVAFGTVLAVRGQAYQSADSTWFIVEEEQERAYDLDPALLVTLGFTDTAAPSGIEITEWSIRISPVFVGIGVEAKGRPSALESAFGVDLSGMSDRVIDFGFSLEFTLDPESDWADTWE